ncbi:hypothetical protein COA08_26325 [Bacillus cereus]|uniref:Uncharacterized protein n=1 Tax=Bacillus cereus TaxID=1396 RepID=A0A2B1DLJ9_BACCE|nr:hypothetical protein CON06_02525 [Bacillus cereus]PFA07190.1 hypothetical protein CN382_25380 [Bacillus cereus]PFM38328.1 hypothetical protein COJ43_19150 [Bacillus cereus]PGL58324.1 hypothetical protein CN927_23060 [Bacillus cereus]PGQ05424.1 hypothetical protein COA08_26325 [Bacillus cereus]
MYLSKKVGKNFFLLINYEGGWRALFLMCNLFFSKTYLYFKKLKFDYLKAMYSKVDAHLKHSKPLPKMLLIRD